MARTEVQLPPASGQAGGIGEKVEATIQRAFGGLINSARDVLVEIGSGALELFFDILKPVLLQAYRPLLEYVRDNEELPPQARTLLDTALGAGGEAGSALLMSLGTQASGAVVGSVLNSLLAPLTYAVNRKIKPARVGPAEAYTIAWRVPGMRDELRGHLSDAGWSDDLINYFEDALRPRLGPRDLIAWSYRMGRDPTDLTENIQRQGYDLLEIPQMLELAKFTPSPPDLVRFGVREAWNDAVSERFGYDQDFPAEFGEWMQKLGDTEGWAKRFWRAHWDLPGLQTVLDLLYRLDEFTMEDLDTYLRTADIPANFRDWIMKTAYQPLTRVDVRRMYEDGVLSADDVLRSNLNLGYSPEDAQHMTDWTVKAYSPDDKDLSKTDILDAYRRGLFSAEVAVAMLDDIGYSAEVATFYVAREDMKEEEKAHDAIIGIVERQYKTGLIDRSDARAALEKLEVKASKITYYLDLWTTYRDATDKRPSVAKLETFYRAGVITSAEFVAELQGHGYSDLHIRWHIQALDDDIAAKAATEAERARAEAERADKLKRAEPIAAERARLDLEIAKLRQVIAATTQALNTARYDVEVQEVEDQIDQVQREISAAMTRTAELREAAAIAKAQLDEKVSQVERDRLNGEIEKAQTEKEKIDTAIAANREQIAELRAILVGEVTDEEQQAYKQLMADIEVNITELAVDRQGWEEAELAARQQLRARITDAERQTLEQVIRDGEVGVKTLQTRIAELRATRETLRLSLAEELSGEQREALENTILQAKTDIRRLQVERAQLKMEV